MEPEFRGTLQLNKWKGFGEKALCHEDAEASFLKTVVS